MWEEVKSAYDNADLLLSFFPDVTRQVCKRAANRGVSEKTESNLRRDADLTKIRL